MSKGTAGHYDGAGRFVNGTLYSLPSEKARKGQVNTWDRMIDVKRKGYVVKEKNPNYRAPESTSSAISASMLTAEANIKTPPLFDRIVACLKQYRSTCSDKIIVVTDNPTQDINGILVPADAQHTPHSGVVIYAGAEAVGKGPVGLQCGARIAYSMLAGTQFDFRGSWRVTIMRHTEVACVLADDSAVPVFRKAFKKAFGKAWKP